MPFPLIPLLAGGGLGFLKSMTIDKPKEDRQRRVAAETAKYSPWTGMAPGKIEEADPFGSAISTAALGAMFSQSPLLGGTGGAELAAASPGAAEASQLVEQLEGAVPGTSNAVYQPTSTWENILQPRKRRMA